MPVNNARVIQFINDTLERFRSESGCCTPVTRAFRDLQSRRRQPGMSTDEDLAAAEHYMFARHAVCHGVVSKQQMDAMVVGYETVKGIAQLFPDLERLMRTTPNPTAPASEDSMIWGLAGSLDGQRDHDRCNSAAEPPLVNTDAYRYGAGGGL